MPDAPPIPEPRRSHTAALGDAEQWPSLPLTTRRTRRTQDGPQVRYTGLWYRVVALAHHRGFLDECAMRLAVHLSQWADRHGRIPDMGDVMEAYEHHHGLSRRTAWADVRRLGIHGAGYIRQSEAPAPGRTARYQLCIPESLPAGLPDDLQAELGRVLNRPGKYTATVTSRTDADPSKAVAESETVTRVTATRMQSAEQLADMTMWAKGSARTGATDEGTFPSWLHTSPSLRGISTPAHRTGKDTPAQAPSMGMKNTLEQAVRSVLARCADRWQAQRGPRPGIDDKAAERLVPLIRGALMYQTSTDVISTITEAVSSARDLGAVVAYRLRSLILAGRRILHLDAVKVDDQGRRYAEVVQERAQRSAETIQNPRIRSAIEEARAAIAAARSVPVGLADRPASTRAARLDESGPARWTERPQDHARALSAAGIPTTDTAWQAARTETRREETRRAAITYARTGRTTRHTAQGPTLDDAAAVMWQEGDPAF